MPNLMRHLLKADKKLIAKWNKILKNEGLALEDERGYLDQWHAHYFRTRFKDIGSFHDKQEYFYKATHFLEEYPFESTMERKFWELHANGKSNREIEKILKIKRSRLSEIMHCLIKAMETWKPQ